MFEDDQEAVFSFVVRVRDGWYGAVTEAEVQEWNRAQIEQDLTVHFGGSLISVDVF